MALQKLGTYAVAGVVVVVAGASVVPFPANLPEVPSIFRLIPTSQPFAGVAVGVGNNQVEFVNGGGKFTALFFAICPRREFR